MSKKAMISIAAIVVIIIIAIVLSRSNAPKAAPVAAEQAAQATTTTNALPPVFYTATTDTSDAALESDMASIDKQIDNMNTNASGIDESLNGPAGSAPVIQ